MCKTSLHFLVSSFRSRVDVWMLLTVLSCSFLPSLSVAQQPTATISALSGNVLVNDQKQGKGTTLSTGDSIETHAGASIVLAFSDGSQLELGEKTKVDMAVLLETATGARISRMKLMWGWVRAKLSAEHQHVGSSFDIETPNALVGVKFSEPDIEVSYNMESLETVGIAHTVELMAKNLLTDEEVLVPVGSSVIITATTIKVIAGIVGVIGTTGTGSTSASSTGTGSSSAGSSGMGTGTKVAIGVGAVAAGGIVAVVAATEESCSTAECTGNLSGHWNFSGSCVAQGCTEEMNCTGPPGCCGIQLCNCCGVEVGFGVTQSGNTLSKSSGPTGTLSGVVDGNEVSFTAQDNFGLPVFGSRTTTFTGILDGNTISGELSGSGVAASSIGLLPVTWTGTFTVNIHK